MLKNALLGERGADRVQHLLIAGKSDPTFACDELVTNPNGELSRLPAYGLDVCASLFPDQRRYTSSARRI